MTIGQTRDDKEQRYNACCEGKGDLQSAISDFRRSVLERSPALKPKREIKNEKQLERYHSLALEAPRQVIHGPDGAGTLWEHNR